MNLWRARAGEVLTTLDARRRELDPETLVIAHADGPSGIAGVLGGADAEISHNGRIVDTANRKSQIYLRFTIYRFKTITPNNNGK